MSREIVVSAIVVIILILCYLVDFYYRYGRIWQSFVNDYHILNTGNGLFGFIIIRVHVGRGHCRLTLASRYTNKTEKVWIIPSNHSALKVIWPKSKSYILTISEGDDFVVKVINFSKEK